jgi:hypothetical protein
MKQHQIRYRVFDSKDNFQQSYSNQLADGYKWARDCAKRVGGYVVEFLVEDGKETESKVIFDLRTK